MKYDIFIEKAKHLVKQYVIEHLAPEEKNKQFEIYVSKTFCFGNTHCAMLTTNINDDKYYEVSSGCDDMIFLDVYVNVDLVYYDSDLNVAGMLGGKE